MRNPVAPAPRQATPDAHMQPTPLRLNFSSPQKSLRQPCRLLGRVMFAMGFIALLASMDRYESERVGSEAISSRLDRMRARQVKPTMPHPASPALQEGIRQASIFAEQLATPLDRLWTALEECRDKDIALLSIDLNPARGEIDLVGEALDFHTLSVFSKALAEHGEFAQVTLTQHKLSDNSPPGVVRFDLHLAWRRPTTAAGA